MKGQYETIMKKIVKKIKNDSNMKFLILLFMIMVMQAIRYYPFKFGGWNQIMLSFTYRYGFIQRAFIGTILDIESTLFHIPLKYMRYIYGIFTVGLWSYMCITICRKAISGQEELDVKVFLKGLSIAFLIGPGWVSYYSNFAITDTWLVMVAILSVYLIATDKYVFGTVLLSIVAELIHPAYVFLIFNLMMVITAYKVLFKKEKKIDLKYAIVFIVNAIAVSVFFLIMFWFAHARDGITIEYVMERTAEFVGKSVQEIENHRPTISGYLFREGEENGIRCLLQSWGLLIVGMAIVFFPFFYEIYRYWSSVYQVAKENKIKYSWYFSLVPFGVVTLIPMYVMQNDYGRWTHTGLIYEVGVIVTLLFMKDKNVTEGTKRYMKYVKAHKWYYVFLIAYSGICGAFDQNLINSLISTVEQLMWKIIYIFA